MAASGEGEGETEGVPKNWLSSSREIIFLDLDCRGGLSAISAAVADVSCPEDIVGLEAGSCAGGTVSIFTMSSNGGANNLILLFQLTNIKESEKTHILCTSDSSLPSSES